MQVDINERMNEYSLIIMGVKPTDAGTYLCLVNTKEDGEKSYDITLDVKSEHQ